MAPVETEIPYSSTVEYRRAYRKTDIHKESFKRYQRNTRAKTREWVNAIKLEKGCIDCGYNTNSLALEFDHVRGTKLYAIGTLVANRASKQRILDEIAKCEVRCANCHKIKTWS